MWRNRRSAADGHQPTGGVLQEGAELRQLLHHPRQVLVTVLEGENTFTYAEATTAYHEGESFIEAPDVVAQARNASGAPTQVMASNLLPAGAPLSHPQADPAAAPASLPNTGEAPAQDLGWPLAIAGAGLLIGGLWLRRRVTRPWGSARW